MDMFNSEFRSRLSSIISPLPSSIRFSKVRIMSMLASGPILASTLCQRREMPRNASTYIDSAASS